MSERYSHQDIKTYKQQNQCYSFLSIRGMIFLIFGHPARRYGNQSYLQKPSRSQSALTSYCARHLVPPFASVLFGK